MVSIMINIFLTIKTDRVRVICIPGENCSLMDGKRKLFVLKNSRDMESKFPDNKRKRHNSKTKF